MKRFDLTFDEITALGLTDAQFTHVYNYDAIKAAFKDFNLEPRYTVDVEEGKVYPKYVELFIDVEGVLLRPYNGRDKGKFFFALPRTISELNNRVDYDAEQPQRVGVPTIKKLRAWRDYLLAERDNHNAVIAEWEKRKAAFLNRIGETAYRGYQTKNGIEYFWDIDNSGRFITEKLRVVYESTPDAYTRFLKLSDNALNK